MSNFTDVKTFMETFGQVVRTKPQFPDNKTMQLRFDLIKEELLELEEAMKDSRNKGHKKYLEIRKRNLHKIKPIPFCKMKNE